MTNLGRFEEVLRLLEVEGANFTVTKRALTLGDTQDAITGWYGKSFTEDAAVKVIILPKGSALVGLPVGYYASYAHTGFTLTSFTVGDEVKDQNNVYYQVKTVVPIYFGNTRLSHYVLELDQYVNTTSSSMSVSSDWSIGPGWLSS